MNFSASDSASLATRTLAFFETLVATLPPRSVSDRTCFRRLSEWLRDEIRAGRLTDDAFAQVLLYAREAGVGRARNPNAVFMSILRKEIGYDPITARQRRSAAR
jgi:hypothetical protein